jgi:hypothetical protein
MPKLRRNGQPAEPRPVPPITECPACGRKVRATGLDGTIGPHERPTQPGEAGHNDIVPTYTGCSTGDRQPGTEED